MSPWNVPPTFLWLRAGRHNNRLDWGWVVIYYGHHFAGWVLINILTMPLTHVTTFIILNSLKLSLRDSPGSILLIAWTAFFCRTNMVLVSAALPHNYHTVWMLIIWDPFRAQYTVKFGICAKNQVDPSWRDWRTNNPKKLPLKYSTNMYCYWLTAMQNI